MTDESAKPDLEHLAWAIDQRAEIQRTLLALYEFVRHRRPPRRTEENYVLGYLIRAAFSLWRAVFLAETFRDDTEIYTSQEKFLEKVITDNAIGFSDDKKIGIGRLGTIWRTRNFVCQRPTVYIENHARAFNLNENPGVVAKVMPFLRLTGTMGVELTRYEWESAHYALRLLFKIIEPDAPIQAQLPNAPKPKGLEEFLD